MTFNLPVGLLDYFWRGKKAMEIVDFVPADPGPAVREVQELPELRSLLQQELVGQRIKSINLYQTPLEYVKRGHYPRNELNILTEDGTRLRIQLSRKNDLRLWHRSLLIFGSIPPNHTPLQLWAGKLRAWLATWLSR